MVETIIGETKMEGQRKVKRQIICRNPKMEKTKPFCGKKLFHPWPF
jgi:hypothetical protein